jgi:hypothetical protein
VATQRKDPGDGKSEIPDLIVQPKPAQEELSRAPQPAPVSRSPERGAPSARQSPSVEDYFGSGTFDADHFGDVGGSPEIDAVSGADRTFEAAAVPDDVTFSAAGVSLEIEPTEGPRGFSKGRALASSGMWPTGRSPESASLVIDPVDVRLAAGYGRASANVFFAPVYAVRVVRRRSEIEAAVKRLAAALADAEKKRDELLVAAALELRGKVLLTEGGEALFAPVLEIEKLALERRSSLAGTNAEYDQRAREIEEGADALKGEAARLDAELDRAARVVAMHREAFDRASAKKKRLYIEIRAIMDAAEKSGGDFTDSQSTRIAELEAAVAAHKKDLDEAEKNVEAAEAAREAAEIACKRVVRRLAEAVRVRRALDDEFREKIGGRAEGVSESERLRAEALAEAMRAILAARGRIVEIPKETLDALTRADRTVHDRALELEKLVRALDSHDRDAYRRGRIVIGVAVAVLIGAVVILVR